MSFSQVHSFLGANACYDETMAHFASGVCANNENKSLFQTIKDEYLTGSNQDCTTKEIEFFD